MANNQRARRVWLTAEQQEEAVRRYLAGEGAPAIAKSYGVCANNIRNAVRRLGHAVRDKVEARTKYSIDKTAFDVVTPESAYWIGFLFADGYIGDRDKPGVSPALGLTVAVRDREHLVKLKTFLKAEHPIYDKTSAVRDKTHAQVSIYIRSRELTDALVRHGMCVKSLDRVAPDYLTESRDFWRGLVDGDGFPRGSKLGVCGGEILMRQFLDFFQRRQVGLNTVVRSQISDNLGQQTPREIFTVTFAEGTAAKAAQLLYTDAVVALDRKAADARLLIEQFG